MPGATTQPAGHLVVSSTSVSFGSVQVGQSAAATVSLSNDGSATLQVSQIHFSSQDFAVSPQVPLPVVIRVAQSYDLTVEFAPTAVGAASGSMILTATGNPTSVTVSMSGTGETKTTGPALQLQSTSVNFGNVQINTSATQSVTITSSGTAALVISGATVTGSDFAVSGLTFPATLNPTQTATLDIGFDPVAAGATTGQITLSTNTPSGSAAIALGGTGEIAAYEVELSWDAPAASSDPPVGYNIYRSVNGSTVYNLRDLTVNESTSYTDTAVQVGDTYSYYVESVDAHGNHSAPSNIFTATIPN
jgi:hypothetical protein